MTVGSGLRDSNVDLFVFFVYSVYRIRILNICIHKEIRGVARIKRFSTV